MAAAGNCLQCTLQRCLQHVSILLLSALLMGFELLICLSCVNALMTSPPTHLAARTGAPELLSVASDGIILWDTQVSSGVGKGRVFHRFQSAQYPSPAATSIFRTLLQSHHIKLMCIVHPVDSLACT